MLEAQDVGDLGTTPRIDRLVVVADAADVLARLREQPQPEILRRIGVLIFVDQHVAETLLIAARARRGGSSGSPACAAAGRRSRRRSPPLSRCLIGVVELGAAAIGIDLALARARPRAGTQPRFFQRSISPANCRAGQRFSSRSAAAISCLSRRSWSSVSRMVKLLCSPTSSAWRRSILAATEWKVPSHGMPFDAVAQDSPDPLAHLARRLVGEGDGENLARPGAARRDQVREPRGQRRGLAGAGAGEHEHRPLGGEHRLALRLVEPFQISGLGGGGNRLSHARTGREREA